MRYLVMTAAGLAILFGTGGCSGIQVSGSVTYCARGGSVSINFQ